MNFAAFLTSSGINIGICVIFFSLYSILRKQPSFMSVYFRRRLASRLLRRNAPAVCLTRFVPSPSWIVKAWETSEEELLALGGLDAVVFLRLTIFGIRIFSIAAIICIALVLPVNYYGQKMIHKLIPSESLEVFTIQNVQENSKWLWVHCLALHIISYSACTLLYFEYKIISKLRLSHIIGSPSKPSHFTVLVRAIPWSPDQSYSSSVKKFFANYHSPSYLSHQMVYRSGTVQKLMANAKDAYKVIAAASQSHCTPCSLRCSFCGVSAGTFEILSYDTDDGKQKPALDVKESEKECAAAFVFFRTRYAAVVASKVAQSSNPMSFVVDLAPEPHDIYWSNLWIPYGQLWIRKIGTLVAATVFMVLFIIPVTFVQGLTQLELLQKKIPFLRGLLKKKYMSELVTGYLPSVVLILFLYIVPPVMMLLSAIQGPISRSGRKKSACCKILCFTIWNVFFVNVFTGSIIRQLSVFSSVKDLPSHLGKAVPTQARFFMTYVLTSGWASMSVELMQPLPLLCNLFRRLVLHSNDDSSDGTLSFPYHTEVPRVLLFALLGFICSILAPLILPFLLIYFFLAYLVYRNQILNVYASKYESGGQYWPIVHNTTIFSLVLTQTIGLGVFGVKRSPIAAGFTVPLIICTLLFNEFCRQRFLPIFKDSAAEVLIQMDRRDEMDGKVEEIYQRLHYAYSQVTFPSSNIDVDDDTVRHPEASKLGSLPSDISGLWGG